MNEHVFYTKTVKLPKNLNRDDMDTLIRLYCCTPHIDESFEGVDASGGGGNGGIYEFGSYKNNNNEVYGIMVESDRSTILTITIDGNETLKDNDLFMKSISLTDDSINDVLKKSIL